MLDVFNSDAFSTVSLTASINKLPFVPGMLGRIGLFTFRGITETTAVFEEQDGILYLIPAQARGAANRVAATSGRRARAIPVPHLPLEAAVLADDVNGVREFGTEDRTPAIARIVNDKLAILRRSHELTHEYQRAGAVQGIIYDADGSTPLYNLFTEFGVTQESVSFDFGAGSTVKSDALQVIELIEEELGGLPYNYIMALCGKTFYRNLASSTEVSEAFTELDPEFRTQQQRQGFQYGDIVWRPYRGKVGSIPFIPEDECVFFPVGVPDLFLEIFAPADFIEAVGTPGRRIYAKQERMKFDRGIELHSQSNPLFVCTRPKVLVQGTDDTV